MEVIWKQLNERSVKEKLIVKISLSKNVDKKAYFHGRVL